MSEGPVSRVGGAVGASNYLDLALQIRCSIPTLDSQVGYAVTDAPAQAQCVEAVEAFGSSSLFSDQRATGNDIYRLHLIREAVENGDWFFVLLNQMQCANFVPDEQPNATGSHTGCLIAPFSGSTSISPELHSFFHIFPISIVPLLRDRKTPAETALANSISSLGNHILHCSARTAEHWNKMAAACKKHKVLPSAHDMANVLAMSSHTLQRIFFGQLVRQSCSVNMTEAISRAENLFVKSQERLFSRQAQTEAQSLKTYCRFFHFITGDKPDEAAMYLRLKEDSQYFLFGRLTVQQKSDLARPDLSKGRKAGTFCPNADAFSVAKMSKAVVYVDTFSLDPTVLTSQHKQIYNFTLSGNDYSNLNYKRLMPSGQILLPLRPSSTALRLRYCRSPPNKSWTQHEWLAQEMTSPTWLYATVNGHALPMATENERTHKRHAQDLSEVAVEGENTLVLHLSRLHKEQATPPEIAVAIELVVSRSIQSILASLTESPQPACITLDSIKTSLRPAVPAANDEDDDLMVLDQNFTIPLREPFSKAKIFVIPARSQHCLHMQAFDLRIYLETRPNSSSDWTMVDAWRCPICRAIARPIDLLVDGFLIDVRQELDKMGRLDAEAIVIDQDGVWKIKEGSEKGVGRGGTLAKTHDAGTPVKKPETEIFAIDDD